MVRTLDACLLTLALLLASCARAPEAARSDAGTAPAAGTEADTALDEPVEEIPPATAPDAAAALAAVPAAMDFAAAAPVAFGASAQALRSAWDGTLEGGAEGDPQACHYLFPAPRPADGFGHAFMFEGGRFVRMDVDDADAVAPGGGRIGMTAAEIGTLYPGRIEERPHKYVEGARYLRVTGSGDALLVFETDAQGRITAWRVGLAPQVDYVEGCG
jgi:hypothetical protein